MNIILIGFKSVGKTTLGKLLAKKLNTKFIDSDDIVTAIHLKEKNEDIHFREIYKKYGKEYFRKLETQSLQTLEGTNNTIIALGGGTLDDVKNQEIMKKIGKIIYLSDNKKIIYERIIAGGIPAFFDKNNPKKSFEELYEKRGNIFENISDITVDLYKKEYRDVIDEMIERTKWKSQ